MGMFGGLPIAVTSPALFIILGLWAIVLFLLLNGRSLQMRIHSPIVAAGVLALLWLAPRGLYAVGHVLPGQYHSVMRVEENRTYWSGPWSRRWFALEEPGHLNSYRFTLNSPYTFRSVDLTTVAEGSCLSVSAVKMPGVIAVYDAVPVPC